MSGLIPHPFPDRIATSNELLPGPEIRDVMCYGITLFNGYVIIPVAPARLRAGISSRS